MTVKDKVGRTRYLAFRLAGASLSRAALSNALPPSARLTRFDGVHGVLRTPHRERDAVQAFLDDVTHVGGKPVRVETLATSGTLRKAAEALPKGAAAGRRERKKRDAGR